MQILTSIQLKLNIRNDQLVTQFYQKECQVQQTTNIPNQAALNAELQKLGDEINYLQFYLEKLEGVLALVNTIMSNFVEKQSNPHNLNLGYNNNALNFEGDETIVTVRCYEVFKNDA